MDSSCAVHFQDGSWTTVIMNHSTTVGDVCNVVCKKRHLRFSPSDWCSLHLWHRGSNQRRCLSADDVLAQMPELVEAWMRSSDYMLAESQHNRSSSSGSGSGRSSVSRSKKSRLRGSASGVHLGVRLNPAPLRDQLQQAEVTFLFQSSQDGVIDDAFMQPDGRPASLSVVLEGNLQRGSRSPSLSSRSHMRTSSMSSDSSSSPAKKKSTKGRRLNNSSNKENNNKSFGGKKNQKQTVHMSGYLDKRGKHNTAWRQRWFVLMGNQLNYFKSKEHAKSIDHISIEDAAIRVHGTYADLLRARASMLNNSQVSVAGSTTTPGHSKRKSRNLSRIFTSNNNNNNNDDDGDNDNSDNDDNDNNGGDDSKQNDSKKKTSSSVRKALSSGDQVIAEAIAAASAAREAALKQQQEQQQQHHQGQQQEPPMATVASATTAQMAVPFGDDDSECFFFDVVTPSRVYELRAHSRENMENWVEALALQSGVEDENDVIDDIQDVVTGIELIRANAEEDEMCQVSDTLDGVLHHPVALSSFMSFCRKQMVEEVLSFWIEAEQYRLGPGSEQQFRITSDAMDDGPNIGGSSFGGAGAGGSFGRAHSLSRSESGHIVLPAAAPQSNAAAPPPASSSSSSTTTTVFSSGGSTAGGSLKGSISSTSIRSNDGSTNGDARLLTMDEIRRNTWGPSGRDAAYRAQRIFDTYVRENAEHGLIVKPKLREQLLNSIKQGDADRTCFVSLQNKMLGRLEIETFPKYLISSEYHSMLMNLPIPWDFLKDSPLDDFDATTTASATDDGGAIAFRPRMKSLFHHQSMMLPPPAATPSSTARTIRGAPSIVSPLIVEEEENTSAAVAPADTGLSSRLAKGVASGATRMMRAVSDQASATGAAIKGKAQSAFTKAAQSLPDLPGDLDGELSTDTEASSDGDDSDDSDDEPPPLPSFAPPPPPPSHVSDDDDDYDYDDDDDDLPPPPPPGR
eukprot:TRINITY_DN65950_c6_g5_i1.p1 TRINITY_DN65950_c6_g5~~TRINITY_DN65950_c6_g5_i1.p1  ORF type:complete len:963 (-),score=541.66 TRINITY_DN65950_c6_g5_i1:44-2932(-)